MIGRTHFQLTGWIASNGPALIFGFALIAIWEAVTRGLALRPNIFPPPSLIIWSLYVRADLLMAHAWLTFSQTVVGFGLSVLIGVPLVGDQQIADTVCRGLSDCCRSSGLAERGPSSPACTVVWSRHVIPDDPGVLDCFFSSCDQLHSGRSQSRPKHAALCCVPGVRPMAVIHQSRIPVCLGIHFRGSEDFGHPIRYRGRCG